MPGFDTSLLGSVLYCQNIDFTGNSLTSGTPQVTLDGQLLIGSAVAPHIRVATLSAGSGISITNANGAITIAASGGSGLTGTATQYATLVGAAGNTVASIGPSSTSGQLLQSGGNAANPSFTTNTYPATNAAGDLLYGSSSNVISSLAVNTRYGSPLGSDGTNPTYLSPMKYIWYYTDFNDSVQNNWTFTGGITTSSIAGHPGVNTLTSPCNGSPSGFTYGYVMGSGLISLEMILQVPVLSTGGTRYFFTCGFGDSTSTSSGSNNGIYFSYIDNVNAGKWQIVCSNASTFTTTNTTIAADTSWHRYRIDVNANATSVSFYIDDVLAGTITTHIPTIAIDIFCNIINSVGASSILNLDAVTFYQALTTSR
jgi:hypothetical protein